MGSVRKKDFAQAVKAVEEIYPNLAVLSELANRLEDPNTEIEDLVKLIRAEAALTVDLIKISNSTFYSSYYKCSDVDTALARIGFNEVLRVVALILAKDLCSDDLEKYGITADELWAESVTVSLLMEEMAKAAKLNRSQAATLGLLHSVGKVVINNILEEFRIEIYWDPSIPIIDWERTVVGFHYGEAGGRFLKQMEFPTESQQIIRHHVTPKDAPRPNPLTYILHYAVTLAKVTGFGFTKHVDVIPEYPDLAQIVSFSDEEIMQMIQTSKSRFNEITQEVYSK